MTGSGDKLPRAAPVGAAARGRDRWRGLALAVGPGLIAMLADTDAGSVTTVAQSGAAWGYRLLLPNLLLIPLMFLAQDTALRLALGTGKGAGELVRQRYGRVAAGLLLGIVALSCAGALASQLSGLAGAGEALGLPVGITMAVTVCGLAAVLLTGSYRRIQHIALLVGLFELAFAAMAWRAAPGLAAIAREAVQLPLSDSGYLYLLAANLGTSIIPWTLLYQQSASVEKGLGPSDARGARLETLAGVVLCQAITSALLIAAAAKLAHIHSLDTIAQIETAFTATLGEFSGHVIFVVGLSGSALVATIVVCLTLSWTAAEIFGVAHSLERRPHEAPWFYGTLVITLTASGALVASGVNLVRLSLAAAVLNALVLPLLLGFLYRLARTLPTEPLRLKGGRAALVAAAFLLVGLVGLYAGIRGLF